MEERGNKTIICSVLFLDIVEYSKKSVSGQISLKERFNAFLSTAIHDIPATDRIILDTGDGAAISFLGDIEDALQVALSMRGSLLSEGVHLDPPLLVRMGINLGPVRLVKDINSQPNIVGDGINVAQRVMGFADVGQLLVSRSYYDAVSRLSQEYAGMFHYQGSRTDKHVREHEIYAIGYPGEFTLTQHKLASQSQNKNMVSGFWGGIGGGLNGIYGGIKNASARMRAIFAGVLVFPLLVWGAYQALLSHQPAPPAKQVVVRYYPDMEQPSAVKITAASSVANEVAPKKAGKDVVVGEQAKQENIQPKKVARVRTLQETAGKAAVVNISVQPWGEVYLDGRMQGVSPPLAELQVASGKHEIEIRNSTFKAYKQTIQVTAGEKIKIKHKFVN
jgi:PEGA domain